MDFKGIGFHEMKCEICWGFHHFKNGVWLLQWSALSAHSAGGQGALWAAQTSTNWPADDVMKTAKVNKRSVCTTTREGKDPSSTQGRVSRGP